ncbi:MAG: hypothetical protein RLZZ630_352 [Bacteroidota bacterium]|jgi:cation:H+ antiporter
MSITTDVFFFVLCAAVIFFAGKRISYYGDLIAELTGMGRAWIGLILMASVTSLPELVVGVSSAAWVKSADLAVGDILGSCAFNLGILSLMDALTPRDKPLLSSVSTSHILAAALGTILIGLTGLGLFLPVDIVISPGLGVTSVLFLVLYLVSVRIIYEYNVRNPITAREQTDHVHHLTLKQAILRYAGFAGIIIAAALWLPEFAHRIAGATGLDSSFMGTFFLAVSTSLPEIAVSIAAIRLGAADMAVGNLFGSNIFNILILFIDDLVYVDGHLLKDASDVHVVSVFAAILMSAVAIIGLTIRIQGKRFLMAWDSLVIFAIYALNLLLLYRLA